MNNCRTNSRTNTTTRTPPHINRHRPNQSPSATQQQQHQLSVLSSHNFDRRPPTPSQCPPLTECVWGTPKPLSTRGCCHRQVKSGKLLGTAAIIASWQPRPSRNIYLRIRPSGSQLKDILGVCSFEGALFFVEGTTRVLFKNFWDLG